MSRPHTLSRPHTMRGACCVKLARQHTHGCVVGVHSILMMSTLVRSRSLCMKLLALHSGQRFWRTRCTKQRSVFADWILPSFGHALTKQRNFSDDFVQNRTSALAGISPQRICTTWRDHSEPTTCGVWVRVLTLVNFSRFCLYLLRLCRLLS